MQSKEKGDSKPKSSFNPGAFLILGDHIPVLIDTDLAFEVGKHILEHGSDNSAVMAFGHQLFNATNQDG